MKKQKPTLSIYLPAHNEEKGIARTLMTILNQKRSNFTLQTVTVLCDGCTDSTEEIVKKIGKKHPVVKVINDGRRLGKAGRISHSHALATSDILINIDSDCLLPDKQCLVEVVKKFDNPRVGLVGAHDLPLPARGFFEHIAVYNINIWHQIRKNVNGGKTLHNHHGCITAKSKAVYKNVIIPTNIIADDDFVFFRTLELGFEFDYAPKARMYYRAPTNYSDYMKQQVRFINLKNEIFITFGEWTKDYYPIPMNYKIKGILVSLLRDPILFSFAILLNVLIRMRADLETIDAQSDGTWETINSSKDL